MRGAAHVHSPVFRTTEYDSLEARFDYSGQRLNGELILLDANRRLAVARGEVRTDLALRGVERRLLEDPFDIEIRADSLPLELVLLPVRSLEEIDGWLEAAMTVSGAPGSLQYGGNARVVGGTAWVPDLGVRYRAVEGSARFRGSEARIDAFQMASRLGGTATLSGTIDFASITDPIFDLDLLAERMHAIDRRDMTVAVEGRGHLGGRYRAPILEGRFRIRDGDIRQDEFLRERQVIDLGDPSIYSLIDTTGLAGPGQLGRFRNPFMRNLQVDAVIDLGPNLWLRSDVLGVEMVGEGLTVDMDRALESLVMVGTVELPRGTYRFDRLPPYSQQLRITQGTIQFVGNPDLNPNIAITAEYRTRTRDGPVVVSTHIGGTLRATELTLSSNPPMSDSNQLCFLAIGAPCYGSADQRFGERLVQESVLGTLSSGLSSALVGSSGLSYFNLRSVGGTREGAPGAEGQSLFDNTELELGWYAGEELFFAVTQPLGGGVPSATMEWRFTENWTLEARAQNRFDQQQYGLFRGTNIANDQTFGLFLFRQWTF
jgi:translocation and assembly module TamB